MRGGGGGLMGVRGGEEGVLALKYNTIQYNTKTNVIIVALTP